MSDARPSDSRLHPEALPPTNEPLRISVRRLRWFKQAFLAYAEKTGAEIGCRFAVDEGKLAAAFLRWLEAIEAQKPADKSQRRAFFEFAAALMLRELTADMPLKASAKPAGDTAAAFWPEGWCCTMFCLSVHAAAMAQEFHEATDLDPAFEDLRHWWSFRENTRADPAFSSGFLQMVLGHQPNWQMPDVFRTRISAELGS